MPPSNFNGPVLDYNVLLTICGQTLAEHLALPTGAIDPRKNFDEMGLDSIDGVLLSGALSERLNIDLAPELFLQHRTIEDVIQHLLETSGDNRSKALPAKAEYFYFPGGGGRDTTALRLVACSGERLFLKNPPLGEWQEWIDSGCKLSALTERCCEWIEAQCPTGGLRLVGHSLGGQVAFAVALKLMERGRDVDGLYLFDSSARPNEAMPLGAWVLRRLTERASRLLDPRPSASLKVSDPADYGRLHASMQVLDLKPARLLVRWCSKLRLLRLADRRGIQIENALRMKLLDLMWRRWWASLSPGQGGNLPVTLFRAQSPGLPDLGWSIFCRNVKIIDAKGDHITMLEHPYVEHLVNNMMSLSQQSGPPS